MDEIEDVDPVATAHVERYRLKASHGDEAALTYLARLATSLLVACRGAHVEAKDSCADAVDIVTEVLSDLDLLPPEQEV